MNNNLKPTENFSKSSFRLNNQSDPGARTCVSNERIVVWHRLTHHFLSGETTCPLGVIHKSVSAHRGHTRHWIYLKTAEMRFLDWIPYEKSFQNWNNKQQKKEQK